MNIYYFSSRSIWHDIELIHTELQMKSLDLSSYDGSQSPGSGGSITSHSRTKRMRTSFKHHQLRTMKSYFAINQNPDAKDLKQLAQKTGLSKRVLQVIQIKYIYLVTNFSLHYNFILITRFGFKMQEQNGVEMWCDRRDKLVVM